MKFNRDYREALKAGLNLGKESYREQQESGMICGICMVLATVIIIIQILIQYLGK